MKRYLRVFTGLFLAISLSSVANIIPQENITASASSVYAGQAAVETINGSGMQGDLHENSEWGGYQWLTQPTNTSEWIKWSFDQVYILSEMRIWNYSQYPLHPDRCIKKCRIYTSIDGVNWNLLSDTQLTQTTGAALYPYTDVIDCGDVQAQYVKLETYTPAQEGTYGGLYRGLAEVRFYKSYLPVSNPVPEDGETMSGITNLRWDDAEDADYYTVYLAERLEDVTGAADPESYPCRGNIFSNQIDPLYLAGGKTYYWRVDTVRSGVTEPGPVWSFRTDAVIPQSSISLSASSTYPSSLLENIINGSGMQGDMHVNEQYGGYQWLTNYETGAVTVTFTFDTAYDLGRTYIWNYSQYPYCPNRSMKNITIRYSQDGQTWTDLGNYVLVQPDGSTWFGPSTIIDFSGRNAKQVQLESWPVALGGTYGEYYRGLAEVRFTVEDTQASRPVFEPLTGGCIVKWQSGGFADSHRVYAGTDAEAVLNAGPGSPQYMGETSMPKMYIPTLSAQKVYVRVDECNAQGCVPGQVWSLEPGMRNLEVFIAAEGSDTAGDGTKCAPFASLDKAKTFLREQRKTMVIPEGPMYITFREGEYYLNTSLELGTPDSGTRTCPLVVRSAPGEEARLIGGAPLDPAAFQMVTSVSSVWSRLDDAAKNNVMVVSLPAVGITDYGILRENQGYGRGLVSQMELFFNKERMQLGRWPNEGDRYVQVASNVSTAAFVYSGDRPARWTNAEEPWLHGYWNWGWHGRYVKVTGINTSAKTLTFSNPDSFNPSAGDQWFALNLLEEIDTPGEWYLNRSTGKLYFWPPAEMQGAEIVVSMQGEGEQPLLILNDASYVRVEGMVVEMCRYDGVGIYGGAYNEIRGCEIRNTGSVGVDMVDGFCNGVSDSEIHHVNNRAVAIYGGEMYTLTPSRHYVRNNDIHHFADWTRTYSPALQYTGVGASAANNLIHESVHAAIFTGFWYRHYDGCNDNRFELNEIYNVCTETEDMAAIGLPWGWAHHGQVFRHNFIHHLNSDYGTYKPVVHGVHGVYLDGCSSGAMFEGNIFYEIDTRGILNNGGRDNITLNNIFVKCHRAANYGNCSGTVAIEEGTRSAMDHLYNLKKYSHLSRPWSAAYPELTVIPYSYDDPAYDAALWPGGCELKRNIGWQNGMWFENGQYPYGHDAIDYYDVADNLQNQNPLFVDEAALDLRLQPGSPAYQIPGFEEIPFEEIGVNFDAYELTLSWDKQTGDIRVSGKLPAWADLSRAEISETGQMVTSQVSISDSGAVSGTISRSAVGASTVTLTLEAVDPQGDSSPVMISNRLGCAVSDFDENGVIDGSDLYELANAWLYETDCGRDVRTDLNGDARVSLFDFRVFALDWLENN